MRTHLLAFLLLFLSGDPSVSTALNAQNVQILQLESQFHAAPTAERAAALSKVYQDQALWFLKLPQYSLDSCHLYFDKAFTTLKIHESAHYQALSAAYIALYIRLYRVDVSPKVDTCLKIARFYFDKMPQKAAETKLLEYDILIHEAKKHAQSSEQTTANNLMVQAFSLIQEDKSPSVQARCFYDKGYFYNTLRSDGMKLSNSYLLQSKTLYEAGNAPEKFDMLFRVYGNLGWYQNTYGTADSCDYYFDKQKALLPLLNDPFINSYYSSTRANNYFRRKEYDKALALVLDCQNIAEKYYLTRTQVYAFNIYIHGTLDLIAKRYDAAIEKFNNGLTSAKLIDDIIFINDGYEHLVKVYTEKGDFENALKYKNLWASSMEKEYDKNLDKSLKENELQLDIVKKDNALNQKAKERYWYIGTLGIGALLLGLVYRNFHLKRKSNQQLEALNGELNTKNALLDKRNAENELLLKEIHHRVKNNLEIVSSLLELQSAQIDDPSVQSAMFASQNRIHSMGIIHQKLYQSEHLAAIEMRDYFIDLGENILSSFNAENKVTIDCNMPKLVLDVDTAISIGLIVNELLTNSLKYAFNEKDQGLIQISLKEDKNDQNTEGGLMLKISDDGIGKPTDGLAHGTGFGTQLINLLTRQLDGKLAYEVNHGTTVSLSFKKVKLA